MRPHVDRLLLNETHNPALRSWVQSANAPNADFPIQNLPLAAFREQQGAFRIGAAIGDAIVDLSHPSAAALLEPAVALACRGPVLNELMALGPAAWSQLRLSLSRALRVGSAQQGRLNAALIAQRGVQYGLPARIGDFSDFYTSIFHATAVGRLLRPDQPLLPNYRWIPIAYHGRASSVRVSGSEVTRPIGQIRLSGVEAPVVTGSRKLDYEVELGVFIGPGNPPAQPIPIGEAWSHVFGVVLLNDWSARDIQAWEYQPLGPFLSKSFATTISPWVVSAEALHPFRSCCTRPMDDPQPLPYLQDTQDRAGGSLDIVLEASIATASMRAAGQPAVRLSRASSRHAYWTIAQMVAHHTINGCNLVAGDLLGTGTQSGPGAGEGGSLIELTVGGREPLTLPGGERRAFLEDGDEITLSGFCEREGFARIGLGTATARIRPAPAPA
jgi:fumarylacetoacetase